MGSVLGDTPDGLIGFIGLQDEGTVILRDSFFYGKLTSERHPEFDFEAVWEMDDSSGYLFSLLSAIQAEQDLVPLYRSAGGNVSIRDLAQISVRADVNRLLDAQVVVTYLPKGIGYRFNNDTLTAE